MLWLYFQILELFEGCEWSPNSCPLCVQRIDIVDTVKVLFLVGAALNDAGVGAWSSKVSFDSVRPLQMIQCGFAGKEVDAWKGPYVGVGKIKASAWQPYQATTFVTPPFAGFVSGHSTFSAAAAGVLQEFFSGDDYLAPKCRKIPAGSSLFEGRIIEGEEGFVSGLTDVPNNGPKTTGQQRQTDRIFHAS